MLNLTIECILFAKAARVYRFSRAVFIIALYRLICVANLAKLVIRAAMHIVQLTSSQIHVRQEFIKALNVNERNEVAKIYDLNPTNDDDLLSVNYHAQ